MRFSVLLPWFTVREVPVDVEIVSRCNVVLAPPHTTSTLALSQGRRHSVPSRNAARLAWKDQSIIDS